MNLDELERARCGDRAAFRALIAIWGDRALRTATLLWDDRARAPQIAADAFVRLWDELPRFHSERPFRPWLMRALLDAAGPTEPGAPEPADQSPLRRCLDALDEQRRAAAVLHLYDGMGATELALMRGTNLGAAAKDLRDALRALAACVGEAGLPAGEDMLRGLLGEAVRGVELPPWFAEETVEPALREPDVPTVRRLVAADARGAWARILEPASVPAWVQAERVRVRGATRLEPGARILARGRLADQRPSRDESLVARAGDDRVLAWVTRSRIRPWPRALELRWTIEVIAAPDGCELVHRLRGVAYPPGPTSRFLRTAYQRVAEDMPAAMHAGIERLARLLEAGTPRTPL